MILYALISRDDHDIDRSVCKKKNAQFVKKKQKKRQCMFVKHVPPLWAYFIEATKLLGTHFKSHDSCKFCRT